MERKLASVQTVLGLQPIEGADSIDVATVLGWKVVVKKNQFNVGDKVVYMEVDSIVPRKPWSDFLDKKDNKKMRIKTIKLRGQISQGIVFPISILPDGEWNEGDDVTEILEVRKYEPPEEVSRFGFSIGRPEKTFPTHLLPKTDEMRIQSSPKLLKEFEGRLVYISTKVDGTSATFVRKDDEYFVCSRNHTIKKPNPEGIGEEKNNVYWEMYEKYNVVEILKDCWNFAIQGEIAGPGIQKNRLGLNMRELFVFNIYDVDNRKYLNFEEFIAFCTKYNLRTVPIESTNLLFKDFTVDQLVGFSNGTYQPSGHLREGIVIRPMVETYSAYLGGRLSTKVINPYYLLKTDS